MINYLASNKDYITLFFLKKGIQKVDADELFGQLCLDVLENKLSFNTSQEELNLLLNKRAKLYKRTKDTVRFKGDISFDQLQNQGFEPNPLIDPKIIYENEELELLKEEKIKTLTSTQLKYLRLFEQKLSPKEIAKELGVGLQKVYKMKDKLGQLLKIKE